MLKKILILNALLFVFIIWLVIFIINSNKNKNSLNTARESSMVKGTNFLTVKYIGIEKIDNSQDKYIIVKHDKTKPVKDKMRIVYKQILPQCNLTSFAKIDEQNKAIKIIGLVKNFTDLEINQYLIPQKDIIVAIGHNPNVKDRLAKDKNGYYCIAGIIP